MISKLYLCLLLLLAASACSRITPVSGRETSTSLTLTPYRQHIGIPSPTLAPTHSTAQVSRTQDDHPEVTPIPTYTPTPEFTTSQVIPKTFNPLTLTKINRIQYKPSELVLDLAYSPDGELLAVSAGDIIHLYKSDTLAEIQQLPAGAWSVSITFSPDNRLLASGARDGMLKIWDVTTGELRKVIVAHKKGVNSVAFSPDGHTIASGGNDAVARLWDVASGEKVAEMIGGTFAVPSIAFTPNAAALAIVNGNIIRLRDINTSRFVQTIQEDASIYSLAISPDNFSLASGSTAGSIHIWDIGNGDIRYKLNDPGQFSGSTPTLIWSVVFNPNGQYLASSGSDSLVRVWDMSNGGLLAVLAGHSKSVTSLDFDPQGRYLASGSLDGTLLIWASE